MRVALIAGNEGLLNSLRRQLACAPQIRLVAWATSLRQGRSNALLGAIDVLLIGLDLDDGDGLELVGYVARRRPLAKAIVMAEVDDEDRALRAFDLGASGWLGAREWNGNVVASVLSVASGGCAVQAALVRRMVQRAAAPGAQPAGPGPAGDGAAPTDLSRLTLREREVLTAVAQGLRSKEVGRELAISDETVNVHIKSIFRKLQVHSRAQLVRIGAQAGLRALAGTAPRA